MTSQHTRPKWWQVYLTLPLLVALFVLDSRLKVSTRGHQAVQIGILLLVYGLIHLWLKANATALSRMDREQNYRRVRVIRIPVSNREPGRLLQFPDAEIKGVLSDAFEMDTIDATFIQPEQTDGQEAKRSTTMQVIKE